MVVIDDGGYVHTAITNTSVMAVTMEAAFGEVFIPFETYGYFSGKGRGIWF